MSLPNARRTALVALLVFFPFLPVTRADYCAEWQKTYAGYEGEVYEAIRDEPEDLPKELRRYREAISRGHNDQAEKIERKVRDGLTGLLTIEPVPEMTRFHSDLVECYRSGIDVLDARRRGDVPGGTTAELQTWRAFRRLFVGVRDLLSEHGCGAGDVEAIDQKLLPEIDRQVEALQGASETSGSDLTF